MTKVQHATRQWLLCRRRNPDAQVRIYCFPHSGGSPGEYVRWADDLPDAEVWGVQLPGRGSRTSENAITDMHHLVQALMTQLDFPEPFMFFGHSLGALIAFETALRLSTEERVTPNCPLLSAMWPPHAQVTRPEVSHLDDADLLAFVDGKYGTVPEEIRNDPDMAALMAPAYRADLQLLAAYRHQPHAPLDIPMTLFGGTEDPISGELAGWREHTRHEPHTHLFPGGHFYFRDRPRDFMTALRHTVFC
ncbi:alpha/beta fold hydrolase [Streptomyces sp. DSM 42041]|uniref:Alpha/beta fold hydrolase n=1 Tax=Streptomyces hazeniae TaxID=3075538 RepID=A0ABU2NYT4_9ACTN|nr:alpha/beta fold hydrolase [Streptomyces sp. DSM 42041]MDT0382155.1 alpha/beta fold hydrolase [Streptomyces sp. DSM 42041]